MEDKFNQDYFERGIETGVSCYQNYRWIPELTIPMAVSICDYLDIKKGQTILDYGCAKGYLVKAMRLLGRPTWGIDVSNYALSKTEESIINYCSGVKGWFGFPSKFDFCIAKDVFEHIELPELSTILKEIPSDTLFVIVPLGKEGKYYAHCNNLDKTHIICEDEIWWKNLFEQCGWKQRRFSFEVQGIKESYKGNEKAHGFFTLTRTRKTTDNICGADCKL